MAASCEDASRIRLELKQWEQTFAATHGGRKVERADIKQHPEIAQRYKRYNELRTLAPKANPPQRSTSSKKRDASTADLTAPPLSTRSPKRSRPTSQSQTRTQSPQNVSKDAHSLRTTILDSCDPQLSILQSPTTHRSCIGPTPQKNGQVLGIFDALSPASTNLTPSKRKILAAAGNFDATPSKRCSLSQKRSTGKRHHKSPMSASKTTLFQSMLTPSACRVINCSTPSEVSKLRFDETPAFLRRDSQCARVSHQDGAQLEEDISWSPIAGRRLPKPAGRGLSALMRGLREMEEERLDEELNIMHEIEDIDSEPMVRNGIPMPKVLVNDSQRGDMPLGPDGSAEIDTENEDAGGSEGKGSDGKPLKIRKKKGQKRTTKRVLMKPNTKKWKPDPTWKGDELSEQEDCIAETQLVADGGAAKRNEQNKNRQHGEDENRHDVAAAINRGINRNTEKRGLVTKLKKKFSATAHANFRALKIKNKQSKAKGRGRFGRKR